MDLTPLIPIAISIGAGIGGAWYARRRGLPDVKAEIETASQNLISILKDQLAAANSELTILRPKLTGAETRIEALEKEVVRLERRIVILYVRIDELESKTGVKHGPSI